MRTGYRAVFGAALVARVLVGLLPVEYVTAAQQKVWSWPVFVAFALLFALGVFLADRAALPTPAQTWSGSVTGRALPVAVGCVVGLLTIFSDWAEPAAAARGLDTLHVSGPAALPFYLYGAILLTVGLHFLPVAFAAWWTRRLPSASRAAVLAMTCVAIAFCEDFGYFLSGPPLASVESGRHVLSVAANGAEAWFVVRFGLLAGLLQRGSTYLIWHLAWPLLGG